MYLFVIIMKFNFTESDIGFGAPLEVGAVEQGPGLPIWTVRPCRILSERLTRKIISIIEEYSKQPIIRLDSLQQALVTKCEWNSQNYNHLIGNFCTSAVTEASRAPKYSLKWLKINTYYTHRRRSHNSNPRPQKQFFKERNSYSMFDMPE